MSRRYRKRRASSDEEEREEEEEKEEQEDVSQKLEETRELQKFRKRPAGVSAVGLAFGKKFTEEEKITPDPFKLKSGGLVDLRAIKDADLDGVEDEVVKRLHSTFSAETNTRDDEAHMLQYIEEEMAKRKGASKEDKDTSVFDARINELYQVPDRLQVKEKSQTEEMLSNQMLSGIPEVNLGLEAKFRNIEETEEAKQKLLEEQRQKKTERRSLAPTNMAANFTLHSLRFYKDSSLAPKKQLEKPVPPPTYIPVVGEDDKPEMKVASSSLTPGEALKRKMDQSSLPTDDYHYDKYKKRAKRF